MKYIVDIKGEIEGDYEIIGKYEERPQGEWRLNPLGDYVCSKCSFVVGKIERNFCPDCGVKMRSDEEMLPVKIKEDVFTRKEELSKEESEWLIDFLTEKGDAE